MSKEIKNAVTTLSKAFKEDNHFAYGWYSNIAMCCYDSIGESMMTHADALKIGREAASRFMKLAFDVVVDEATGDGKVEIELDLPVETLNYINEESARLDMSVDEFIEKTLKGSLDEEEKSNT